MENTNLRQRARKKLLKVTFPTGKSFCYASVTDTFVEVIKEIGYERFPEINLTIGSYPMISKEVYPKYKDYIKAVVDGWNIYVQSDTHQKYIQLRSISDSLNLNLTIEVGEDLQTQVNPNRARKAKSKDNLLVKFSDGEYVAAENAMDTYLEALWKLGIDTIFRKGIEWGDKPLIATYKSSPRQVQVGINRWAYVPNTTKEKAKVLRVLAIHLKQNIDITII